MTRIRSFDFWIAQFRKIGFEPIGGNPFRASVKGLLCDYGPTAWVILWAVTALSLYITYGPRLALIFPAAFIVLGVPLWFMAARKARSGFPPGWIMSLQRKRR